MKKASPDRRIGDRLRRDWPALLVLLLAALLFLGVRLSLREEKEPTVVCDALAAKPQDAPSRPDEAPKKKQRAGFFVRLSGKDDPRLEKLRILTAIFTEGQFPVYTFDPTSGKYSHFGMLEDCEPVLDELQLVFGAQNVARRG